MSANLTDRALRAGGGETWDEVVRGARARHFMFERAYMDYHQDRFADASWFVLLDGSPDRGDPGLATRRRGRLPWWSDVRRSAVGPISRRCARSRRLEAMTTALRRGRRATPPVQADAASYHLAPAEEDLYALTSAGARLVAREVTAAVAPASRPAYSR